MFVLNLLSRLPLSLLYALTDCLYLFLYHVWRFRRQLSLSNLRNSFPDKSATELDLIARQAYRNACNVIAEVLKGAVIGEQELRERVRIVNAEALTRFTRAGQTVILLASHHCNWEWLLLAGCLEPGVRVDAVYKPLRVATMDRFFLEMRSRFGGNPISIKGFQAAILRHRGTARVLALAADQTPPWNEKKRWSRFLNQDTAFFVGADRIARIMRAPVFFAGMRRLRRGYYETRLQLLAEPPYDGEDAGIIERYARAAESHIVRYPADWLWMYRKWKYKKPLYA